MAGRPRLERFWRNGRWNTLRNPDGPPTAKQLARANFLGLLELRGCQGEGPLSKSELARALDEAAADDNPFVTPASTSADSQDDEAAP